MKTHSLLPFNFDQQKLYEELKLVEEIWIPHFNSDYYQGDWSGMVLRGSKSEFHPLSAGSPETSDFEDYPILDRLPYTRSVISSLKTEKSSIRYLRLRPGSVIKPHQDRDLVYWDGAVRLHIPIVTNPDVLFLVDDRKIEMKPGECWFADFSKIHSVENNGKTNRVHLVIDCKVNDWLKELFIHAGILEKHETAPDPMDEYPETSKMDMLKCLREMGTETSLQLALELEQKYNLSVRPE